MVCFAYFEKSGDLKSNHLKLGEIDSSQNMDVTTEKFLANHKLESIS